MKWFGIGTAVMALAVMSGPIYGQERPQGSQGSPGQASPASPGQSQPSSPGQPGSHTASGDRSAQHPADPGARSDARGFINDMTIANLAEVQLGKMASEKGSSADVKSFGQMMVKDHTQANDDLKKVASQLNVQPPAQIDQKHKDLSDKLSKLSGAEFDREYINAMVMGHEEVLGKLRAHADAAASDAHSGAAGSAGDHGAAGDRTGTTGNRSSAGRQERDQPNTTDNSSRPAQDAATAKSQAGKGGTTGREHGDEQLTQWAAKTMPVVQKHLDHAREIQMKLSK